jgi:hypothetical protein
MEVAGRHPTQVENRQQRIETLRPPRPLRQDRRGKADFLLRAHVASVAHLGATDLDRPDPGLDCPMRPMAMTHDAVAAIWQFQILPHGDKAISFGDQHLSQHAAGAFTCKFAERIVDRLRLTEPDNSAISRHGVSLLSGGSGRLDTRLDTPPSINRRQGKIERYHPLDEKSDPAGKLLLPGQLEQSIGEFVDCRYQAWTT